jgi:hypothetical protein
VLVDQREADFHDAQHDNQEERHHDREFNDALAALVGESPADGCGAHWNFGSFFIVESTVIVIRPDGKNGRMSGVKNVHV